MEQFSYLDDEQLHDSHTMLRRENSKPQVSAVDTALINAYLDGRLKDTQVKELESRVLNNSLLEEQFVQRQRQRELLLQMIPDQRPGINTLRQLKSEIRELNTSVLHDQKGSWFERIWSWLTTPFVEIKY